jgi:hypothetical protein
MPDVHRKSPDKQHVQSVIFDRNKFSIESANKWCKDHKFFTDGLDKTGTQFRFRQYDPDDELFIYRNFKENLPAGVSFILAIPKEDSKQKMVSNFGDYVPESILKR